MTPRAPRRGATGSIACGHGLAAQAGVDAYAQGGNAVDAAVACAYALMVLMPDACGLGGDAVFLVSKPDGAEAHHGAGLSPRRFRGKVPTDGAGTTAVPGALAALAAVAERYARLTRHQHLAPATRLASDGFPVSDYLAGVLHRQHERLANDSCAAATFLEPGLVPGAILKQPELADAFRLLELRGPTAFYSGTIADAIARRAQVDGGHLDRDDLEAHRHLELRPLRTSTSTSTVWAAPPPSQAVLGLSVLKALSGEPGRQPADRVHVGVEATEAAFAHRSRLVTEDAGHALLDTPLAFDRARATRRGGPSLPAHTTAVAAADADGLVVSLLLSVYSEFGCGALVPEFGFFLNDRMHGFDDVPGSPNLARPAARPVHTLSPFVVDAGGTRFAAATPGGHGQVQTMSQVLDGLLVECLSFGHAVDRPRWRTSDAILCLEGDFDPAVAAALADRGHVLRWFPGRHESFGAVVVAGSDPNLGSTFGLADDRREAHAASR